MLRPSGQACPGLRLDGEHGGPHFHNPPSKAWCVVAARATTRRAPRRAPPSWASKSARFGRRGQVAQIWPSQRPKSRRTRPNLAEANAQNLADNSVGRPRPTGWPTSAKHVSLMFPARHACNAIFFAVHNELRETFQECQGAAATTELSSRRGVSRVGGRPNGSPNAQKLVFHK